MYLFLGQEIAQLIKYLSHNLEDLSSSPRVYFKERYAGTFVTQVLGELRQLGLGLADQ